MSEIVPFINYYCREGYWRHLQKLCMETLNRRGNDPFFSFWKAVGMMMEGNVSESLREFDSLRTKKEVSLCSLSAMIHLQKISKDGDDTAIQAYTMQLQQEEQLFNDKGLYNGAMFLLHIGQFEKAREYTKRITDRDPKYAGIQTLRGWIDLSCGRETIANKSIQFFEAALSDETSGKKDLEARLGQAKYLEMRQQFSAALDIINQIIVLFSWYLPSLVEKARLLMMNGEWEQALETSQRILGQESMNIEALRVGILYQLVRESRYSVTANRISDLLASLDRNEPKNAKLYYTCSRPFARLSGRNNLILQQTMSLIERARNLDPTSSPFTTELAYQQSLLGDFTTAQSTYRQAIKLDDGNINALHGLIKCQIQEGRLDDAEEQLQFLTELQVSMGKSSELSFLGSLLAVKRNRNMDLALRSLDEAIDLHLKSIRNHPLNHEFYVKLNPEYMLECARQYLQQIGNEPSESIELQLPLILQVSKTLDTVCKYVPGLIEIYYLLARCRFVSHDFDGAQRYLQQALRLDATHSEAHLLMAQVHLESDKFKLASQSLELALSHNFEIRGAPIYHLISARVQQKMGNDTEALRILDAAMLLPGVKSQATKRPSKSRLAEASLQERASIFLQLAQLHTKMNHIPEAAKAIQDALNEFANTSEEVRVIIANAQLSARRGDVDGAFKMLRNINKDMPYHNKAKVYLANLYLTEKNDKRKFIQVYEELANKSKDAHSTLLLGDALMRIQEPERAIEKYEEALKRNPTDSSLATKIGQALVNSHDYKRAIDYYEQAVKSDPGKMQMRYDLAELYMKLKRYDVTEKVINQALSYPKEAEEMASTILDVKFLVLLAKAYKAMNQLQAAIDSLLRAKEIQSSIINKAKGEQVEFQMQQKHVAAKIAFDLADMYDYQRVRDKAIDAYKEALRYDDSNSKVIMALANLYLSRGELEDCQKQCTMLLRMDPGNEQASIMLADLMFQKNEFESATFHFQQLLERKPNHYAALARLIELLRRAGKLKDAPRFLSMAENLSQRAGFDPGLHYCKGIHHRYTNNPMEALKSLNHARKDGEWGERALIHMIEIYLNPDNEDMWEEPASEGKAGPEAKADNAESVRAAEKLLKELSTFPRTVKHQILECYVMMGSRSKTAIDSAIQRLTDLLNVEKDSVAALLALSTAHMMQKQTPKARNHLKRVAKMPYDSREAEEFEKSWLVLAEIYIEGGKYDLAQELLKKITNNNRSSSKAWAQLGFIMEKEQSYRDAAEYYESAWRFENEANPAIGFKLSFNYMKAKRYVEAIDVCHKVLAAYPNYPKIRKDILDKARAALRP